ncbi:MAG TPA: phosphotransferase [Ktedonobacteraceae bacterium]|nr:phosphotransferase [Ktedonobacteraceae bacterium]
MLDPSDICWAWNLASILATWTPETGTIHRTLLLKTATANYALRAYRYTAEERWRVVCEHALIAYVREHNLPAIAPVSLSNGATILEHAGRFYALYPFAPGQQVMRRHLMAGEIAAMGTFLGQLHRILRDYPHERVPHRSLSVDHAATLSNIGSIETAIRSQKHLSEQDQQALSQLAERRSWLMTAQPSSEEAFSSVEQQVIHGDYQETNLFFAEGKVSAIIDWDQAYVAPRAWEIVRTLHYVFQLDEVACGTFLNAYRQAMPLAFHELEVVATAYEWIKAHDLWHYEALYLEGNQRVRPFLQPEPFFLFANRWQTLRNFLCTHCDP